MRELTKLWVLEVTHKNALRLMLKGLNFSFCIKMERDIIFIKIDNDRMQIITKMEDEILGKKVEGKETIFLSVLSGEQMLRTAVQNKEIKTTLTYREQLLLEALFYLAAPQITKKIFS